MQLFDLNGDMLAEILTVCNKSSLLALSRTSSFGNILATPYLLRSVQLDRDRDQVISFLHYIITGSQGYDRTLNMLGIHIQTLQICYPAFFPRNTMPADRCQFVPNVSWASGLTRAIALMPNIRTIEIEHSVESLFENSRSFVHTLMMSPHLRHIKLRGVASFACELLGEAFEARDSLLPLQTLAVCALPFFGRGLMVLVSGEGIGKVLFQARDSLTEVCLKAFNLWNFTCPPAADPQHPGHNLDGPALPIQFPRVKTLYLDHCAIPYSALSYSFPEVRILTISNSLSRISYARPTSPCSSPTLLPKLSSLNAPDFDVLKFLQLGGTYINLCRLVIIDRPGLTPILFPYSTDDLLTMLLAAPNLRSLHFSPPNHFTASDIEDMQWWHNFIKHVSHLTFLHFSVFTRVQQGFEQMVRIMSWPVITPLTTFGHS